MATTLIITGDIHLNLSNNPSFEKMRYEKYIHLLVQTGRETPNSILILNGDIFDKAKPTPEEVKIFYASIQQLNTVYKRILVIPGNHEDLSHKKTWFDFYPAVGYEVKHYDKEVIDGVVFNFVSHANIGAIGTIDIDPKSNNILVSHYRSEMGFITTEVDNDYVSSTFDLTILSDIHFNYKPRENIVYTSSPYNTHYTEKVANGFIKLTVRDGAVDYKFTEVNLPNKIKLTMTVKRYLDTVETLDESNLYKINVKGTFEELQKLPTYDNVILNTIIVEANEDILDEEVVVDDNSVIDFSNAIINLSLELGGLPEGKFRKIGEDVLKGVA